MTQKSNANIFPTPPPPTHFIKHIHVKNDQKYIKNLMVFSDNTTNHFFPNFNHPNNSNASNPAPNFSNPSLPQTHHQHLIRSQKLRQHRRSNILPPAVLSLYSSPKARRIDSAFHYLLGYHYSNAIFASS